MGSTSIRKSLIEEQFLVRQSDTDISLVHCKGSRRVNSRRLRDAVSVLKFSYDDGKKENHILVRVRNVLGLPSKSDHDVSNTVALRNRRRADQIRVNVGFSRKSQRKTSLTPNECGE